MAGHLPRDLKDKVESAKVLLENIYVQAQAEGKGQVVAFLRVSLSYLRAALEELGKK